jgi:ComF family protein
LRQRDPWRAPFRALAHAFLESLWPADCLLCGGWLPWRQRGGVCDDCWGALPWAPGVRRLGRGPLLAVAWGGDYGGGLRRLVHVLKFEKFDPLGAVLGGVAAARMRAPLAQAIASGAIPAPDLVVPVPLHWTRRWRRGFNQSLLLAGGLAAEMRLPLLTGSLVRQRRGRRQIGLRRRDRLVALAGVFSVRRAPRRWSRRRGITGRTILLVDDVTTTGATLEACAAALRRAGARAVVGCVVARTRREGARSGHGRAAVAPTRAPGRAGRS